MAYKNFVIRCKMNNNGDYPQNKKLKMEESTGQIQENSDTIDIVINPDAIKKRKFKLLCSQKNFFNFSDRKNQSTWSSNSTKTTKFGRNT